MIRVMLSADLKNASTEQRDDFNDSLATHDWIKLQKVDTVWCKRFAAIKDDDEGFKKVKNTVAGGVKRAAAKAKVKRVTYVAQLGNREAIGRIATKGDEKYSITHYDPYVAD